MQNFRPSVTLSIYGLVFLLRRPAAQAAGRPARSGHRGARMKRAAEDDTGAPPAKRARGGGEEDGEDVQVVPALVNAFGVEGLIYVENVITPEEEVELLKNINGEE